MAHTEEEKRLEALFDNMYSESITDGRGREPSTPIAQPIRPASTRAKIARDYDPRGNAARGISGFAAEVDASKFKRNDEGYNIHALSQKEETPGHEKWTQNEDKKWKPPERPQEPTTPTTPTTGWGYNENTNSFGLRDELPMTDEQKASARDDENFSLTETGTTTTGENRHVAARPPLAFSPMTDEQKASARDDENFSLAEPKTNKSRAHRLRAGAGRFLKTGNPRKNKAAENWNHTGESQAASRKDRQEPATDWGKTRKMDLFNTNTGVRHIERDTWADLKNDKEVSAEEVERIKAERKQAKITTGDKVKHGLLRSAEAVGGGMEAVGKQGVQGLQSNVAELIQNGHGGAATAASLAQQGGRVVQGAVGSLPIVGRPLAAAVSGLTQISATALTAGGQQIKRLATENPLRQKLDAKFAKRDKKRKELTDDAEQTEQYKKANVTQIKKKLGLIERTPQGRSFLEGKINPQQKDNAVNDLMSASVFQEPGVTKRGERFKDIRARAGEPVLNRVPDSERRVNFGGHDPMLRTKERPEVSRSPTTTAPGSNMISKNGPQNFLETIRALGKKSTDQNEKESEKKGSNFLDGSREPRATIRGDESDDALDKIWFDE